MRDPVAVTAHLEKLKSSALEILGLEEVIDRVDRSGAPRFLVEGLWPADAYGVLGAEDKAGKTWAALDLGVSVATGTPWFGRFTCPSPGPVTLFLGEGGERYFLRRLEAISASRALPIVDLIGSVRACFSVPRLRDRDQLAEVRAELEDHSPKLVVIDPLYLAAAGAKGSDLYEMGDVLGGVQRLTQEAKAALVVTTHWNKTGTGSGPERFTGVGPGAWGRVLASAAVERRGQDPDGSSVVLLRWDFRGSEIPDTVFRMRRRVRSDDPRSLTARLFYEVEVTSESEDVVSSEARIFAVLEAAGIDGLSVREIGDALASDGRGKPLTVRTIQRVLNDLAEAGRIDGEKGDRGRPGRWWLT
ncbi:MAG TPA: AAA family ATPase [Actinomycetota bacterium]|nr:AAA family ATPase [Actinomycetota bacterium]